jgi:transposase
VSLNGRTNVSLCMHYLSTGGLKTLLYLMTIRSARRLVVCEVLLCINNLTYSLAYDRHLPTMSTPTKKKALLASGTLNPHPEAVRSDLFKTEFFDPCDLAQVKYEMLRAHKVDEDPVAEACRQFGFSRETFYRIERAFHELGFCSFLPAKRGRKGPIKLKGEVLEFALAKQKEDPDLDPGRLADLIRERYGIPIHRTTVLRGMKKKQRSPTKESARSVRRKRRPNAGDL